MSYREARATVIKEMLTTLGLHPGCAEDAEALYEAIEEAVIARLEEMQALKTRLFSR